MDSLVSVCDGGRMQMCVGASTAPQLPLIVASDDEITSVYIQPGNARKIL